MEGLLITVFTYLMGVILHLDYTISKDCGMKINMEEYIRG
jgi:hypothetical protein